MAALIMVRMDCCETYKSCGSRCSNCPHRKENHDAVAAYKQEISNRPFGRRLRPPVATEPQLAAATATTA